MLHCDLGTFRHRPKKVCYYDNLMIPIHKHLFFAISEEFLSVLNKRIILKQQQKKNNKKNTFPVLTLKQELQETKPFIT